MSSSRQQDKRKLALPSFRDKGTGPKRTTPPAAEDRAGTKPSLSVSRTGPGRGPLAASSAWNPRVLECPRMQRRLAGGHEALTGGPYNGAVDLPGNKANPLPVGRFTLQLSCYVECLCPRGREVETSCCLDSPGARLATPGSGPHTTLVEVSPVGDIQGLWAGSGLVVGKE